MFENSRMWKERKNNRLNPILRLKIIQSKKLNTEKPIKIKAEQIDIKTIFNGIHKKIEESLRI